MIKRLLNLAQAIAAVAVLMRLSTGAQRIPAVRAQHGHSQPARRKRVSVVIPARDEAKRISACLEGLALVPTDELIVVDDESTDETAGVAVAGGAKVVAGLPLPPGWVGKPWALQQGLEAAKGDWVVFLDADTIPEAGLIDAAIAAAEDGEAHVLSLACRFRCASLLQRTLHASMLFTLIYRFGPIGTRVAPSPSRTIANGQCMIVRREWLLNQGGFAICASNMTDDIAFARGLAERGARIMFLDGTELISVRMHDTTKEVWSEWGRSLPMVDVSTRRTQVLDLATIWLTTALPMVRLALSRTTALDRLLLGLRYLLCLPLIGSYEKAVPALFLSPLTDVAAAVRLTQTTLMPVRSWRGRNYVAPRNANQ